MAAMRDMLANIQFQEPPREDNPDGEGDEEWDWFWVQLAKPSLSSLHILQ